MPEPVLQTAQAVDSLERHPLLRLMSARAEDLVCVYDTDGQYVYVSPSCDAMLGYAPKDLVGQAFMAVVHEDDCAALKAVLETLAGGSSAVPQLMLRMRRKDGQDCWLDAHFVASHAPNGTVRHIYSIAGHATARHITEEKFKEAEAQWNHFVEQYPEPIVMSKGGCILYINRAGAQRIGVEDVSSLIGRSLYDFILPSHHEALQERISRVGAGERISTAHYAIRNLNGDVHEIEVFSVPIMYKGEEVTQTIWRDITEQRGAAEALRESQRLLSSIYHNISEGIYRTSVDGHLIYGNQALARIFGYDDVEALRRVPIESLYVYPEQRGKLKTDNAGNALNAEVEFYRRDGSRFWGLVNSHTTLGEDGQVIYYDGAIADISDRKAAELALREAKESAEEMTRLKSAFLANMSHEIRTPLTAILGFAEIMAEEAPPDLREFAGLIRSSGQRLMETLNSVLDLAQLEGGSMMMRPVQLDIVQQVMGVLFLLKLEAEQRGLDLRIEVPSKQPVMAVLDQGALTRILTNLVSNALKFTPQGSITIVVGEQAGGVEIRVEDTGIGIAPEVIARTFDTFYQVSSGMSRDYEGSGLGLSITKHLVELMGGTIHVESEAGKGSSFIVRFPR